MSINFKKNEKALLAAYQDVLNEKTDTNWYVICSSQLEISDLARGVM
jgi:hypothetical protein